MFAKLISNGENGFAKDSEQHESHSFEAGGNTQAKKSSRKEEDDELLFVFVCYGPYNRNTIDWVAHKQKHFFFPHAFGDWKAYTIKVPSDLVSGERVLTWFMGGCLLVVSSHGRKSSLQFL